MLHSGPTGCCPIDYYDSGHIYAQLDDAAKSFVNSSEVLILPERHEILLSEIFRWYDNDFGRRGGILDFIFDYLVDDNARNFIRRHSTTLHIDYLHYDWNLNR
jgi:hypothetical protein